MTHGINNPHGIFFLKQILEPNQKNKNQIPKAQVHIEDHKQTLEKYEISQRNEEITMDFD